MDLERLSTLEKGRKTEIRILGRKPGIETCPSAEHPDRNDDSAFALWKEGLYGVFDGAGGHVDGDIASREASDSFQHSALKTPQSVVTQKEMEDAMRQAFIEANKKIFAEAEGEGRYTTASVVKLWRDSENNWFMTVGNNGDSRVYLYEKQSDQLEQVTLNDIFSEDDECSRRYQQILSNINTLEELNHLNLSPQEIGDLTRYFRQKDVLRNPLGMDPETDPANPFTYQGPRISTRKIASPETSIKDCSRLLIVSDGIYGNLLDKDIMEIMKKSSTPKDTAKELVHAALKRGKKDDDMTAVVVYLDSIARRSTIV